MKIGFAIGKLNFQSGIVKVVFNIASELENESNYEVYIISTGCSSYEDENKVEYAGIKIINLDIEKYGHRKKYLYYTKAVSQNILDKKFDTIVVSGTEHVLFYAIGTSKMKSDVPRLFVWEHRNFIAGPKFRLEWLGKRYAIKKWDGVLCITKKDYNQYIDHSKDRSKIYQIYNLTDFNTQRKSYNLDSQRIISCGYLSQIKGFDMLIEVAKKVFESHPDWSWDIYGEGTDRAHLQQLINDAKLNNNLFLKGYASNINELYNQYAFFVLTSRTEGMGMVLIEAQKSGLPVVSFDIKCGPSDVIMDGENGYLIEPFEIKEMAKRICDLIEDENLRKNFSDKSEMNLDEFDKDYIRNKWIQMLEQ